jgi:hypothetical protein
MEWRAKGQGWIVRTRDEVYEASSLEEYDGPLPAIAGRDSFQKTEIHILGSPSWSITRRSIPYGYGNFLVDPVGRRELINEHVWSCLPHKGLDLSKTFNLITNYSSFAEYEAEEESQKKRIRQVRDALNKCRDMEVIEQVASILHV